MSKWVPGVALIGLICVMSIPAPGLIGITIGCCCVLAIAVSLLAFLLDRLTAKVFSPIIAAIRQLRTSKKRRRSLHAGSGMVRKT